MLLLLLCRQRLRRLRLQHGLYERELRREFWLLEDLRERVQTHLKFAHEEDRALDDIVNAALRAAVTARDAVVAAAHADVTNTYTVCEHCACEILSQEWLRTFKIIRNVAEMKFYFLNK